MAGGVIQGGGCHGRRPKLADKAQEAKKTRNKMLGEIEGRTARLTATSIGDERKLGTVFRAEGRTAVGEALSCGGCSLRGMSASEK